MRQNKTPTTSQKIMKYEKLKALQNQDMLYILRNLKLKPSV